MRLLNPYHLLLWILPVVVVILSAKLKKKHYIEFHPLRFFQFSPTSKKDKTFAPPKIRKHDPVFLMGRFLIMAGILTLIFASARPARVLSIDLTQEQSAIDIIFTVDISTSMNESIGNQSRIEASAQVFRKMLAITEKERVGLVVFAEQPYTVMPLSFDHHAAMYYAMHLPSYPGTIMDGTAIWDALMVSTDRFSRSDTPSKVILLITDGENNRGIFHPNDVEKRLAEEGIRLYTLMILDRVASDHPLIMLSRKSGGQEYVIHALRDLDDAILSISQLERDLLSKKEVVELPVDYQPYFILPALIILSMGLTLEFQLFKGTRL